MDYSYWKKQTDKPLFPDIEWSKPEQRSKAGKLGIIGGSKSGFLAAAEAYSRALAGGVGEAKVLLPKSLKKAVSEQIKDVIFSQDNASGGLSKESFGDLEALGNWADAVLLIGDAGKNSETAIVYERFLNQYDRPLTITRDAFDLLKNNLPSLVNRPDTLMVLSLSQAQKLFRSVYYPKLITFSTPLNKLVEALHKFTTTYPLCLVVYIENTLVVAHDGQIVTTALDNPMSVWRGTVAARATIYWLWNKQKPLEAVVASLHDNNSR